MEKPSVLLDVDGVLADFVSAALGLVHHVTGRRYEPDSVTAWEVFDSIPEKQFHEEVYRRLKSAGGCLSIPVYDGAKDGVARLRQIASVTILTSPFYGSPTWTHEREKWLEEHFGIHHRDIVHTDKKFRVHGDVFIDDKPSHLHSWLEYWVDSGRDRNVSAVLWDSARSRNERVDPRVIVARTWQDVIDAVRAWRQHEERIRAMTLLDEAKQNEPIMQFFAYDHLKEPLQTVSKPFCELAEWVVVNLPRNAERTVALRKLLEGKDAAVRAHLAKK